MKATFLWFASLLIGFLSVQTLQAQTLAPASLAPSAPPDFQPTPPSTGVQPNFVLILADDLGINDLHCYGRDEHRTPHLDALAERGIRYTSAYCGLSICSASRAALMTGKSSARLHLTTFLPGRADNPAQKVLNARIQSALPAEERTIAEELQKVGYRTGLFGKWHLGGGKSSAANQGFEVTFEPKSQGALNDEEGAKNEFAIAKRAAEFIRTESDKPYFCYIPHHSPHIRLEATDEAIQNHSEAFNPLYAANIESLDKAVGIVLEAIASQPSSRETYILFTSDNGGLHVPEGHQEPVTHNAPFRAGKGYLYEGGLRVPLIVASSKQSVAPNRTEVHPVSLMDIMPTFLSLAGVDVAKTQGPLDGVNLSENWIQQKPLQDRAFGWNFPHYTNQGSRPAAAMRIGSWKLVLQYEDNSVELYNLESDIAESNDLAKVQPEAADALRIGLEKWLDSVGAQRCQPNPEFDANLHAEIYKAYDSSLLKGDRGAVQLGEEWKPWREKMGQAGRNRKPVLRTPQGDIELMARDATTHGSKLRYEPEPNKNVLGYWTDPNDWAHWNTEVERGGRYEVEVQIGCGLGQGGSKVAIHGNGQSLEFEVPDTGHFQNMIYKTIGELELPQGEVQIEVRPILKRKDAVMDIRKIVLRRVE